MSRTHLILVVVASLLLNIVFGYKLFKHTENRYPYLSKRLFTENQNDILINFQDLRTKLRAYPEESKLKIGIYFEYLPSGTSIGVNEKDVFFSASLIKVPLVMRTYNLINKGQISLTQSVALKQEHLDSGFGGLYKRGVGATLTVEELIRSVITESDNTAYNVLAEVTNSHAMIDGQKRQLVADVYDYLDLPDDKAGGNYGITTKNYASVLRSLYLSAYLPYDQSNQILTLMTESSFKDWLPQPIPGEVKVAHKFGLYDARPEQYRVHSDCGIIYYPKRPYLLCVMVPTGDPTVAAAHIRKISQTAYDFVSTYRH